MRKHSEIILKYVCLILAALVLYQLVGIIRRVNPLHGVTVPALPMLTANTNSSGGAGVPPVSASSRPMTNITATATGTNAMGKTNSMALAIGETNSSSSSPTNLEHAGKLPVPLPVATNVAASASGTNLVVGQASSLSISNSITGTNVVSTNASAVGMNTHSTGRMPVPLPADRMAMSSHNGMRGMGMGGKPSNLPPAIQAQVTKIIESEILGPVPHPLPMALMGIAGDVAFLRSPSGQTGMVKLGDSLGEIKLVRIGVNRVLVEQDGEQKELTIFDGYGGESLLEKQGGTNNETHN